jgi:hypothetical protein
MMKHLTRKTKRKRRKNFLKKGLTIHTKITLAFFIFYLLASLIVDPRFLLSDFREKYSSIAASSQMLLSIHIVGLPEKPVAIANWFCDDSGSYIQLDWNATEDTTSYDIYKDSVILAANLTDLTYRDDIVAENTSYAYRVVASGPLGSASSDEIVQATGRCGDIPTPTIQIKNLNGKNIENQAVPETTNRDPIFAGTTNIPNAIINVNLGSGSIILSSTIANSNGYWEWQAPTNLDYGDYQITFTAVDPSNESLSASATKNFRVVEENDNEKEKKNKKKTPASLSQAPAASPGTAISSFGLSVAVENTGHLVYAGQNLILRLNILKNAGPLPNQDLRISYSIVYSDNKSILELSENINPLENKTIEKNIKIPALTKDGNYKIVAKIYRSENVIVSSDDSFIIKELPIFTTGAISITSLDLMQNLGWLLIMLLIILFLFLMLLGIEHYLSEEALFQITDNYLDKNGLITKRKGANK